MKTRHLFRILIITALALLAPAGIAAAAEKPDPARLRGEFLQLCDAACRELNTPQRTVPFYHDAYAVRALAVAYDMTGEKRYLDMCRAWSDKMLEHQAGMTPRGGYWMNYGRKPGETKGNWYVADCASIAMGVLATAVRTPEAADRQRYLDSVKAYAQLVRDNYYHAGGGVTDGIWYKFDGEWWCSTALYGSLMFLLYQETGERDYLQAGLETLDWLNKMDFRKADHTGFKEAAPAVVMYVFEAFSAAMAHLDLKSPRGHSSAAHIAAALEWMHQNQGGREAGGKLDYNQQWGCKMGGLPFHQYVYARYLTEGGAMAAADQELDYLRGKIFGAGQPKLTQLVCFAMMSYAEKLSPGAIYRKEGEGQEKRRSEDRLNP